QLVEVLLRDADAEGADGGVLGRCAWLGRTWAGRGAQTLPFPSSVPGLADGQPAERPEPRSRLRCRHGARGPPSLVRAGPRSHPPMASPSGQSRLADRDGDWPKEPIHSNPMNPAHTGANRIPTNIECRS